MNPNRYINVGPLVNSCVIGANAYRILSGEDVFASSLLEEITDNIRQNPGRSYMLASSILDHTQLWMVPFAIGQDKLPRLQTVMEKIQRDCLGIAHFHFPFDVVEENGQTAYLIHPIDRQQYAPLRSFLPDALAERWIISTSLFQRVLELKHMGLTSNGISREQLRLHKQTHQVDLWLNETVGFTEGSADPKNTLRHEGFLSIPVVTENECARLGIPITGTQRDVFSAAVAAFYLILYTHPFVGSGFYGLLRDDYLTHYQNFPEYVMMPDGQNGLGNQLFGRVVSDQWERTVPALKELFDSLFMAVSKPKTHWKNDAPCWDPEKWLEALALDAEKNDNETSHSDFHFANERYHQV